jgi:threonine/homoserine/homoserine lactone efflux protein
MPAAETLITFFIASLLLGAAPGPDNIFVMTQSAQHGRISGLTIMLGLCTGLLVHTLAVAGGIAVLFQTSPLAFTLLKSVGAVYLLYLAWQAFAAAATSLVPAERVPLDYGRLYRRGIIMNVTNPKVSIFFLAFLPQFADPARGPLPLQMVVLGGIFIVATILVFGAIALLAGTLGEWLSRSAKVQKILNRVAGTVFVLLALKLSFTE